MAKRRYHVKRGQTYLDIANATGVDIGALLSVNAATPTPVGGFNVNIPTAPNIAGAPPPPPRTVEGGAGRTQVGATTPGFTTSGYYTSPLTPATPTATGPTATPGFTSTGYYYYASPLSPSTTQTYGQPVYDAQGNVIAASGGTVTPQPIGGTEGSGVGVSTAPNNIYGVDAFGNTSPKVVTEEQRLGQGANVTQMQAAGYTYDNVTRTWTLTTTATTTPKEISGGWYKSSDGSWHLNRNASQTRKKEERAANRKKANQSSTGTPVNWSI